MSETKTHCSCGRRIADNFELRATIMALEKNWENASSACNKVAGERDKYKQQLATAHRQGWEQCRAEILTMLKEGSMFYDDTTAIEADIASMEYKEAQDV